MSNKLYILFSGILVSITMVGLFIAASKLQEGKAVDLPVSSVATNVNLKQHQDPVSLAKKDHALTILNMWYDLSPEEDTGDIRVDEKVSQVRKVGIHSDLLAAVKPGSKVQLPRLIGEKYFLRLDKVEKISDSEIQIYGELEGQQERYFSTISIIDNTLLAVLSTPQGDYDIKMVDGRGVVYKSDDELNRGSVIDQPGFLDIN